MEDNLLSDMAETLTKENSDPYETCLHIFNQIFYTMIEEQKAAAEEEKFKHLKSVKLGSDILPEFAKIKIKEGEAEFNERDTSLEDNLDFLIEQAFVSFYE